MMVDLDGTLVDSVTDLHVSANDMLGKMGLAARPESAVRLWVGNGIDKLIHRCLTGEMDGEAEIETFLRARDFFDAAYEINNGVYSTLYEGVVNALDIAAQKNIRLGCVTNKDARFAHSLLQRQNLAGYFPLVIAGDTLAHKKPHPQPLLHAASVNGAKPSDCVLIGDSMSDLKAAKAAGFGIFCVSYGYSQGVSFADLQGDLKPDGIVDSMADLPFLQNN